MDWLLRPSQSWVKIDYYRVGSYLKRGKKPKYLSKANKATKKDESRLSSFEKRLERFPLEIARFYRKEIDRLGLSLREYSKTIGISRSTVSRYLKILKLPDEAIEFLDSNKTPEVLRRCSLRFLNKLIDQNLSNGDLQTVIRDYN